MNDRSQVRIHNMVKRTKVLGPGERTAIWFQGCNRNCKGCMSPTSRPLDGGKLIDSDLIINEVLSEDNIEGITISGGEPFLQIEGLYYILKKIRENSVLGIIIYTGFMLDQLIKMKNIKVDEIVSNLSDLIIDGEYVDELNDGIALRGSSNQKLNFITERYKDFVGMYNEPHRNAEVIATEADMFLVGIPEKRMLSKWKDIADKM